MSKQNPYRSSYNEELLNDVAEKMCKSLIEHALVKGVDLDGIDWNTLNHLDGRFGDGGEARCERFTDLGWEFASEYGTFEEGPDDEWEWAQEEVITKALELLPERWEAAKPKKTIDGPNGLRIELDKDEINPNDPGQGTPAMVYKKTAKGEASGTYWRVQGEGEMDGHDGGTVTLTERQMEWINGQEEAVQNFLYPKENA